MNDFTVEIHDPCIYLAKNHPEPPLDPEADAWFKEARRLEKQSGQPRDYPYIAELYQKAAKKKHWKAMANLSQLYDVGLGVEKSTEKSIALGNELIAMDATAGYIHLGSINSTGLGVPKNMRKAETYFYEASIRGNARTQTYFGDRLIFKHKGREDEGKHLLECALAQEHWEASEKLAMYYLFHGENNRKSLEYLLLGIKNGNRTSLTNLAQGYTSGERMVKKNLEKAECLRGLRRELDTDPNKKFPDVESRCGISIADVLPDQT